MALNERSEARSAAVKLEESDPELDDALAQAKDLQLNIAKENNRHKEQMYIQERGRLGAFFGNQSNAACFAAYFVIVVGIFGGMFLVWLAHKNQSSSDMFTTYAERILSLSVAALTFLFGKSSKD